MYYKRKANAKFTAVGILITGIWLAFLFSGTEVQKYGSGEVERVSPFVGVVTILFFGVMGFLFYIRSITLHFHPSWSYSIAHRIEAYSILGIHMMKMERQDMKSQLSFLKQSLRHRFRIDYVDEIIAEHLKGDLPVIEVLEWFRKKGNEEDFINILDLLADLAFYNDEVNRQEISFLFNAGRKLGIDQQTIKSIFSIREQRRRKREEESGKSQTAPKKGVNYYRNKYLSVLGLNANSNFEEVKKAYRDMARKLHPDRFNRESEEEQKVAHERFTEINLAYEKLKEIMG